MKILIMGGTGFLGPHIVEKLSSLGHELVLFNRGQTNQHLFPDLDKRTGDRLGSDLTAIEGETFDAVVDINAYVPRVVREILSAVDTPHYVFVSTISVYPEFEKEGLSEADPVADTAGFESDEEVTGASYGPLKVLCEQEAQSAKSTTILRPGLVVGPLDPTDRFTYWLAKASSEETFIAPGTPQDRMQFIDVRDFAEFTAKCVEEKITGTYNVVIPPDHAKIGDAIAFAGGEENAVWFDDEKVEKHELAPWGDFPAWVSPRSDMSGLTAVSSSAALERGLVLRTLKTTVCDTLDWYNQTRHELKTGLDETRVKALLELESD